MVIQPSEQPGSCERHLLRKAGNPLFPDKTEMNDDNLLTAQGKDHDTRQQFNNDFMTLVNEITGLSGNVESDIILELKNRLDQAYEAASIVGGDQGKPKEAIRKLIDHIMAAVRRGAGSDMQAQHELDQETAARDAHFALLECPLVADLLNPDSPIHTDELIPTLLTASKEDLQLALQIFDEVQLVTILGSSAELVEQLQDDGVDVSDALEKLAFMQGYAEFIAEGGD